MSNTELLERIDLLDPDDFDLIVALIDKLAAKKPVLKRLSEDEIVEELSDSVAKSDNGCTKSAKAVSNSMRKKYAV